VTVNRRTLRTFDNQSGRNVFYRAAIHPMTAPLTHALVAKIGRAASIAVYDPSGYFGDLAAMYDLSGWKIEGVYVQRLEEAGRDRSGHVTRTLPDLAKSNASLLFVAEFDGEKLLSRLGPYRPNIAAVETFDALRLGKEWLTVPDRYLDPLNFVSDFLFFRDADGFHTAISTVNYWHGHGAKETRLWCRLFDAGGSELASWEERLDANAGSIALDSRAIRKRFNLGDFTGSLFVHVIGTAAHDTLKYAVDVFDDAETATATHDSNPWPADFYAGLPAPRANERVKMWVQNCYPTPIPKGAIGFRPMGREAFVQTNVAIPPYGTAAFDVAAMFPDLRWPEQVEIRADRYCCRPRYEIEMASGHRSVAHVNVERTDLRPAADLAAATKILGKGFILPAPILPPERWRSIALPTPMARTQTTLPVAAIAIDGSGREVARHRFGTLPRNHAAALDLTALIERAGLPIVGPDLGAGEYLRHMRVDKKAEAGAIKFVVLASPGEAVVRSAPDALVADVIADCCKA